MAVYTVHLLAISVDLPAFILALKEDNIRPFVISKVLDWAIKPETISLDLLNTSWDVLIIVSTTDTVELPPNVRKIVTAQWFTAVELPVPLSPSDFAAKNRQLLHPSEPYPLNLNALAAPSVAITLCDLSHDLAPSRELWSWAKTLYDASPMGKGAISMLNLLAFNEGPAVKESYNAYIKAFLASEGVKHGGDVKFKGTVVPPSSSDGRWEELIIAHYPSIAHFCDMVASEDYQVINKKFRLPALKDTFILCTTEMPFEETGGISGISLV